MTDIHEDDQYSQSSTESASSASRSAASSFSDDDEIIVVQEEEEEVHKHEKKKKKKKKDGEDKNEGKEEGEGEEEEEECKDINYFNDKCSALFDAISFSFMCATEGDEEELLKTFKSLNKIFIDIQSTLDLKRDNISELIVQFVLVFKDVINYIKDVNAKQVTDTDTESSNTIDEYMDILNSILLSICEINYNIVTEREDDDVNIDEQQQNSELSSLVTIEISDDEDEDDVEIKASATDNNIGVSGGTRKNSTDVTNAPAPLSKFNEKTAADTSIKSSPRLAQKQPPPLPGVPPPEIPSNLIASVQSHLSSSQVILDESSKPPVPDSLPPPIPSSPLTTQLPKPRSPLMSQLPKPMSPLTTQLQKPKSPLMSQLPKPKSPLMAQLPAPKSLNSPTLPAPAPPSSLPPPLPQSTKSSTEPQATASTLPQPSASQFKRKKAKWGTLMKIGYKVESKLSVNNTEIIKNETDSVIDSLICDNTSGIFELNKRATKLNLLDVMLSNSSSAAVTTSAKAARLRENAVMGLTNDLGDLVFFATRAVSDMLIVAVRHAEVDARDKRIKGGVEMAHKNMISIMEKIRKYIYSANDVAEDGSGGMYSTEVELLDKAIAELKNPAVKIIPDYLGAAKESESKERVLSVLAEEIAVLSKRLSSLLSQLMSVICAFSFRSEIFGIENKDSTKSHESVVPSDGYSSDEDDSKKKHRIKAKRFRTTIVVPAPKESIIMENALELISVGTAIITFIKKSHILYNTSLKVFTLKFEDKLSSSSLIYSPGKGAHKLHQSGTRKFRPLGKTAKFNEIRPNEFTPMLVELNSSCRSASWYKFSSDGMPVHITMNKLIDLLVTCGPDLAPRLTEVALYMLPAYTTGAGFINKLIERFMLPEIRSTETTAGSSSAKPDDTPTKDMQERICKLVKQLVETQFHVLDKRCVNDLNQFLTSRMAPIFPEYAEEISLRICVQLERREREISSLQVPALTGALEVLSEGMTPLKIFRVYDEQTIASQLKLISTRMFAAIHPREFVKLAWSKSTTMHLAPNINRFQYWIQALSDWMRVAVLAMKDEVLRVEMIKKITRIAKILFDEHDYNDSFALYTGLNQPSVANLNEAKIVFGSDSFKQLDKVFKLGSFVNYREELAKCTPGQNVVPIFHVFIQDFNKMNEGEDKVNDMINFGKHAQYYSTIKAIVAYQNRNFHMPRIEPLYTILSDLSSPSVDICYWLTTTYKSTSSLLLSPSSARSQSPKCPSPVGFNVHQEEKKKKKDKKEKKEKEKTLKKKD